MVTDEINPVGVPSMRTINAAPKTGQVISLFAGVGGSSTGYKMAGLNVVASVEFLDYQAENYRLNHPGTRLYQADIRKLNPAEVLADLGLSVGELDVLDGSPPCSSFSSAGLRNKAWGQEKKYGNTRQRTDDLFFEYVRFLRGMKPKVFVAENVKGLVTGKAKGYFNAIFRELTACGYQVHAKVLNAANYGVPQQRERLIFVGVRTDLNRQPVFPQPLKTPPVTVKQAFSGLNIRPGECRTPAADTLYRRCYEATRPGEYFEKACQKLTGKANFFTKYRLSYSEPSPTLNTCSNDLFHPAECRYLSVRERKRLSSLPDDFVLQGGYSQEIEATGRLVPPLLMKAIAETIRHKLLMI